MTYKARTANDRLVDVDDCAQLLRNYDGYLMLQHRAMEKLGPGAQTLAGLLEFVNSKTHQTFASLPTIANRTCLPVLTVRRHLAQLQEMNFIRNLGRERKDPKKQARRTCTYVISNVLHRGDSKYIELPRWAAQRLSSWSDRAVYAAIISRRLLVERIEESDNGGCAEDRLTLSAGEIVAITSLSERSVWRSLDSLTDQGYIDRVKEFHRGRNWCRLVLPKCFANAILPSDITPPLLR